MFSNPQTIIKENRVHQALKNKKSECSFAVSVCEYHPGPPRHCFRMQRLRDV